MFDLFVKVIYVHQCFILILHFFLSIFSKKFFSLVNPLTAGKKMCSQFHVKYVSALSRPTQGKTT